ncbi:MAG: tRNA 2-thiouridine(34) synthase MnmA [Sedimentisphaerales bacterium]|nr:tRNA 2-thiouridine(34) synthase MnmA [Sedimentisphaerales bacterium]
MTDITDNKVLVAMSGGVDSSVAAGLLQEQGYRVSGLFMRLGQNRSSQADQQLAEDDARRVADVLGIELITVDFRQELEQIIDYFVAEYRSGRTPNPCIMCNRRLKFGRVIDYAREHGFGRVATGHYARVEHNADGSRLCRAVDLAKDQSYSLFGMGYTRLASVLFPTGDYHKSEIREIARRMNLPVHDKGDSMEICFVPDDDYIALLAELAPELDRPGNVIDTSGKVVGHHNGVHRFTIGQRKGVNIPLGYPAYVISIDPATNTVVVGGKEDAYSNILYACDMVWLSELPPVEPFEAAVQVRYNNRNAAQGIIYPIWHEGQYTGEMRVEFSEPVLAVTPGQAAVVYEGQYVSGGGWISSSVRR